MTQHIFYQVQNLFLMKEIGYLMFDFFFEDKSIFIEISAHPLSIEKDLEALFTWLRKQTGIVILDEDGELAGW